MKIIFFGSSDFSIPALKVCRESPHELMLVITTPPQKKGRGLKLAQMPVHQFCLDHGLPVETPDTLKNPELLEKVRALGPEVFVASSYGKFIPSSWLKVPSKICFNVHPSLLPKYRGAAPLNWPILNGDTETGLSIAEITGKLDAGDVFYQERFAIPIDMDSQTLSQTLAEKSFPALRKVFSDFMDGKLKRTVQDESQTCYARMIEKKDGMIDWSRPAFEIHNQIRGLIPWPTAYASFEDAPIQLLKSLPVEADHPKMKPGMIAEISKEGWIQVQTGKGCLKILQLKPAGKNLMNAADFARGRRIEPGHRFQ